TRRRPSSSRGGSTAKRRWTGSRRPCGSSTDRSGGRRPRCSRTGDGRGSVRRRTASRRGKARAPSPSSPRSCPHSDLERVEVGQPLFRLLNQGVVADCGGLVPGAFQELARPPPSWFGLLLRRVLQRLVSFHDELEDLLRIHCGLDRERCSWRPPYTSPGWTRTSPRGSTTGTWPSSKSGCAARPSTSGPVSSWSTRRTAPPSFGWISFRIIS